MRNVLRKIGAVGAALIGVLAGGALITMLAAQGPVPSLVPPFNIDLGQGTAAPGAAGTGTTACAVGATGSCTVLTLAAQGAGTVNSNALVNLDKRGALCTLSGITSTGGPSLTFAIQAFDAIANAYQTLGITGSLTTPANASLMVYPGITGTAATGLTITGAAVLPRVWRVQAVVTGGTGINAKISCNIIR